MSTRDMYAEINDSYKGSDGSGRKIGHHLALIAEIENGQKRLYGEILNKYSQCGPLLFININQQSWDRDCVVTFKYKKAFQYNTTSMDYKLTFIGEWERDDRYPTEDDYLESILEVGDYWVMADDYTILGTDFVKGEFIICTSVDPITWVRGEVGWNKVNVRDNIIYEPMYVPYTESGSIVEYEDTITIPAGERAYVQHYHNNDFVYEITDLSISDSTQKVMIYSMADDGIRTLYGFNTEHLRHLVEYLHRHYFPVPDTCPACEGSGLEDEDVCSECDGYRFVANQNENTPDGFYDYLIEQQALVKGLRKESETWESFRWKTWSKFWWVDPTREKIKNFVGHFLNVEPERIDIEQQSFPEAVWTIRIPLNATGNIIETNDHNLESLIYEISPAGTSVIIKELVTYYEGDYILYADNYYNTGVNTEIFPENQINYGCILPSQIGDRLCRGVVGVHIEDMLMGEGYECKIDTLNGAHSPSATTVDTNTGCYDDGMPHYNILENTTGILYLWNQDTNVWDRYDYEDYDNALKTFTLLSGTSLTDDYDSSNTVKIYYKVAENEITADYQDFFNSVDDDKYIDYTTRDVPISVIDIDDNIADWDNRGDLD